MNLKKKIIKRYEKQTPGELAHIDVSKLPKDIRCSFKIKELYIGAICDDCTRLIYAEVLGDKKASTLTYFMARSLSWFKQIYNFEFESIMSDNGAEFKGQLKYEHPFQDNVSRVRHKTHIYQTIQTLRQMAKSNLFIKL